MKKVLSLVLVLTLVLGSFSFAFAATDDITGHENEAAIRRLVNLGLVKGDSAGYRPDDTITRAEFAAMAVRVLGKESVAEISKGATAFKDVPAGNWASGYIRVATTLGLINGYGDGNFGPSDEITYDQALAIVLRVLGYGVAAEGKGGWPIGYLVVADDLGLTDKAEGVAGLPASRALVFQILDNALVKPMMVQNGYIGNQPNWVVDEDKNLLEDALGYTTEVGRVKAFNTKTNKVTLTVSTKDGQEDKVYDISSDFDFNYFEGLNLKVWLKNKAVATFVAQDTPQFVSTVGNAGKIKLGSATTATEVAEGAYLELDGDDEVAINDFDADYAKVVVKDGKIVWAKGYTFEFIVVAENDDAVIYGYDNDELDIEDFLILADGKTITAEDVEEGDILFYNYANEVAVVYNNSKVGEIERVYVDKDGVSFRLDGTVYNVTEDAKYLDGKAYGALNATELDKMMDEDEEVEVYFNHAGNVVLVEGYRGEEVEETSSYYGIVKGVYTKSTDRKGKDVYPIDILNDQAEVVEYNLAKNFDLVSGDEGTVVKVTLNSKGAVTNIEKLAAKAIDGEFKVSATYAKAEDGKSYRLQSSTLVFYKEKVNGKDVDKVVKLADAGFEKISAGKIVVSDSARVLVVIADKTAGGEVKTEEYTGLVTKVRKLSSGILELTFVDGKVLYTEAKDLNKDDYIDQVVTVAISEKTGDIDANKEIKVLDYTVISLKDAEINIGYKTINDYELDPDGAYIYDITGSSVKTLRLRDLNEKQNVRIYLVGDSDRFVNYVIVTTETPE